MQQHTELCVVSSPWLCGRPRRTNGRRRGRRRGCVQPLSAKKHAARGTSETQLQCIHMSVNRTRKLLVANSCGWRGPLPTCVCECVPASIPTARAATALPHKVDYIHRRIYQTISLYLKLTPDLSKIVSLSRIHGVLNGRKRQS